MSRSEVLDISIVFLVCLILGNGVCKCRWQDLVMSKSAQKDSSILMSHCEHFAFNWISDLLLHQNPASKNVCVKCKDSYHTDKYRCKAQDIKQVFLLCIYFLLASIQQFYLGCFLTFLLCISCPLPSKVGMRNGSVSIKSLPGGFCCQNCLKVIAVMMERRD